MAKIKFKDTTSKCRWIKLAYGCKQGQGGHHGDPRTEHNGRSCQGVTAGSERTREMCTVASRQGLKIPETMCQTISLVDQKAYMKVQEESKVEMEILCKWVVISILAGWKRKTTSIGHLFVPWNFCLISAFHILYFNQLNWKFWLNGKCSYSEVTPCLLSCPMEILPFPAMPYLWSYLWSFVYDPEEL